MLLMNTILKFQKPMDSPFPENSHIVIKKWTPTLIPVVINQVK